MLDVSGLHAFYGRAHVLHGLDFTVPDGALTVLLGRNGAGKSTTMKALIGLVRPQAGCVVLDGQDLAGLVPHRIAQAGIGYVPEERRIFTDLTVAENLAVARLPARPGQTQWTEATLFDLFPALGRMRARKGGQMSGGEQQMLTIARTLMGNPRLLLLDEPSEGLAPVILEQIHTGILALRGQGVSVLMADQNLHFAQGLASHALVLESGRLVWSGTMDGLRASPAVLAAHLHL